jgi:hypothetical protein
MQRMKEEEQNRINRGIENHVYMPRDNVCEQFKILLVAVVAMKSTIQE